MISLREHFVDFVCLATFIHFLHGLVFLENLVVEVSKHLPDLICYFVSLKEGAF